jgi:hypothetical protein
MEDRIEIGNLQISNRPQKIWDPILNISPEGWDLPGLGTTISGILEYKAPELSALWNKDLGDRGINEIITLGFKTPGSNKVVDRMRALAMALLSSIAHKNFQFTLLAVEKIAGLGGGLTPSGDDFLLGLMIALWLAWPDRVARHWNRSIADAASPLTTSLSAAWLRAGGRREAGESWHSLLAAWQIGDLDQFSQAVSRILDTGQTSGVDALAGFGNGIQAAAAVESRSLLASI